MLKQRFSDNVYEAGVDEAGRGCLAGDVYAAAVIFPPDYTNDAINDSKKLTPAKRRELADIIRRDAIAVGVGIATVREIDEMNILQCSMLAMKRALEQIRTSTPVDFIIVDGNRFPGVDYASHATIVKGDAKYLSIAAASIIAKTMRDEAMDELAKTFPQYQWEVNKGYPTKAHRAAIAEFGPTIHHRMTFRLLP